MDLTDLRIGADRFLALKWANYAFELSQTDQDPDRLYGSLRKYLDYEIEGDVSSRKTSNQLRRMWLTRDDNLKALRLATLSLPYDKFSDYLPLLHFGMAMNIFPVYRETARTLGILERIIDPIPKQSIIDRVLETFGNTSSVPRIVYRVLQTLVDWGFIHDINGYIELESIIIENDEFSEWFIIAILSLYSPSGLSISEINFVPEMIKIQINNLRYIIQHSTLFYLDRDLQGNEIIKII